MKKALRKAMQATALFMLVTLASAMLMGADSHPAAALGQPAPAFSLQNQDGSTVNLSDYAGKIVVLEWVNPECPFVVRHYKANTMTTLANKYASQNVVWVAINSTNTATNESNKQWVTQHSLPYSILNDSAGTVGHEYGAKTTPHMYIIDTTGKLVYHGAIDDDDRGTKSDRVNYVDKALGELLANQPISQPDTKPYGCSVKYK